LAAIAADPLALVEIVPLVPFGQETNVPLRNLLMNPGVPLGLGRLVMRRIAIQSE
jgi:hypothetical protein